MTPQQKLERLIELANETQEILKSMEWDDAVRVISVDVCRKQKDILMSDSNDFKTLYPNHEMEESHDGLSYRLYTEHEGFVISAYEAKEKS